MRDHIITWTWNIDSSCRPDPGNGNPFILFPNWGQNRPQLQCLISEPVYCEEWSTLDIHQVEGPSDLLSRPIGRITRGQRSPCMPSYRNAQCSPINTRAEPGMYVFEAVVGTSAGGQVRAQARLELRP